MSGLRARVAAAVLGAVTVTALASQAAVAEHGPAAVDCASPPAGAACIVVTGSDDVGTSAVALGEPVHFTFAVDNRGASATHIDAFRITTNMQIDFTTLQVNGHRPAYAGVSFDYGVNLPADGGHAAVTFTATRDFGSPRSVTSLQADGTASNDVVVTAADYDLRVANDEQALPTDPLRTDEGNPITGIEIGVDVSNVGVQPVRTRLTFPVPAGWSVRPGYHYENALSCSSSHGHGQCDETATIPDDGNLKYVAIAFVPPRSARLGAPIAFSVTVQPIGHEDTNQADNQADFRIHNAGTSDLTTTITSAGTQVARGGTLGLTVSVTNAGPDPTSGLNLFIRGSTTTQDAITQLDPHGPGSIVEGSAGPVPAGPPYNWEPGVVQPGQTVRLTLAWRGEIIGATARLDVSTSETGADPDVPVRFGNQFDENFSDTISVVRHVSSSEPPSPGTPPLAATGPQNVPTLLGTAALLILLGAALTAGATRRGRRML